MTFKNIKIKKIALIALTLALLAFSIVSSLGADAQTSDRGIIVSPSVMDLEADRGSSYQFTVTVENDSGQEVLEFKSLVNTFTASDHEGVPAIEELPEGSSLRNWIKFEKNEFSVRAKEKFDSNFTLTVPNSAEPGSYFLAITYANSSPQTGAGSSNVEIEKRVASLLFVNVKGKVNREVEFTEFKTNQNIYDPFFDNLDLDYIISTEGKSFLKPSGNVFFGESDDPREILDINPDKVIILPDSSRTFSYTSKPRFDWFNQASETANIIEADMPLFGKQEVSAQVIFVNSEGQLDSKKVTVEVFFFPWKLLILITLGIGLAALAVYLTRRYLKTKKSAA